MRYLHKSYYGLDIEIVKIIERLNKFCFFGFFFLFNSLFLRAFFAFFCSFYSHAWCIFLPESIVVVDMYVCMYVNDDDALLYSHLTTCFFSLLGDDNVCIYHLKQNDEDDEGAKEDTRPS